MGLKDKMLKKSAEISAQRPAFTPLELNEGNVQAIYNRCAAIKDSEEITKVILFSTRLGFTEEDETVIHFDKNALSKNMQNIEYLYGQLGVVHLGKNKTDRFAIMDFSTTYTGRSWSENKGALLELLYLGCGKLTMPFVKESDSETTVISDTIKPTLSPKDPNFPAWWEEHKAEWETEN